MTTMTPIKLRKSARHRVRDANSVPICQMQIAETLPASVFADSDLADNHLPMHEVQESLSCQ
jgi:hypothetical protein